MGFWSRLTGAIDTYDAAQRVLPAPYEPFIGYSGIPVADPGYPLALHGRVQVEALWRTQPNVRKVVDFIARNVASIPLHAYERVSDTDRRRVTGHPLSQAVTSPRAGVGAFRFWHGVISDGLLYDKWAVLKQPRADGAGVDLVQVPSWRLRFDVDGLRRVAGAWYWVGDALAAEHDRDGWRPLDLASLVFDHGYAPSSAGMSPLETLREVLAENTEAVRYRRQVWSNGARVPAWIERPADHNWTPEQRDRFVNHFRNTYTGDGENAGGVPVLEDGMQLHALNAFTPQDSMDLEGRRLTSAEVASAFHVAPELVGAQQGTYSNIDAFRQMLYRDSLGPYITALEQSINAMLTPDLAGGRNLYVEAHVEAKLRGSFIEQAQIAQSAVGAPTMTRNEMRARMNQPPIPGGDALVTPLNVTEGGQASPRDSGSQNRRSGTAAWKSAGAKARAPENHETKHAKVMADFFGRQARVVKSRIGADEEWWDEERWDGELGSTLLPLYLLTSEEAARRALDAMGLPDYDVDRTVAFLEESASRSAHEINTTTRADVASALGDDEPTDAVAHVFDVAGESRSSQIATTTVAFASGFATIEVARQNVGESGVTKTWRVTSGNPRASHASMDGETVDIDDVFSNGLRWPGGAGDPDESAGCQCEMDINLP